MTIPFPYVAVALLFSLASILASDAFVVSPSVQWPGSRSRTRSSCLSSEVTAENHQLRKSGIDLEHSTTNKNNEKYDPVAPRSTGLEPWQEEELEQLFDDALMRMTFIMEAEAFATVENPAVRDMFRTCLDSVHVAPSTIPGAGRGLFASQDIPKGTIVAFYPIHAIGCKFDSGYCFSSQISESPDDLIDMEKSEYALFAFLERKLLGVDLQSRYHPTEPRLFVDMNPNSTLYPGWFCGLINDCAIVQHLGDVDYYKISRGPRRNVEIVPFGSVASFQVGITTREVPKGEEFFVSYGYNYWATKVRLQQMDASSTVADNKELEERVASEIRQQEDQAVLELMDIISAMEESYADASLGVTQIFESLGDFPVPAAVVETNNCKSMVASTATARSSTLITSNSPKHEEREQKRRLLPKVLQTVMEKSFRRWKRVVRWPLMDTEGVQ